MKFRLPGLLALVLAAAGCSDATISLGGGSEPDPNPKSVDEGYAGQYNKFMMRHRKLQEALFSSGMNEPNFVIAREWARDCVDALGAMQKMLAEPQATELGGILENYRGVYDGVARNRNPVSSFQLDNWSREVRRYSPGSVTLKAVLPPTVDGSVPPTPPQPHPQPQPTPTPTPIPGGKVPDWLSFKAWDSLHAELEDKWNKAEDCKFTYERLVEVLQLMQASVPKEKLSRLVTYTDYYQKLFEDTKGFKEVPRGATKQNVLDDLKAVSSGMRLYFNPERR